MRSVGLALEDRVPDAKTIWLFRQQLTRAGAVERLSARSIASCARSVISPWAGKSSMPRSLRRDGLGKPSD
jgi:transposase, IS5 family